MGSEPDRENSRDGAEEDSDGDNDDTSPNNTRESSTVESPSANGCYVVSTHLPCTFLCSKCKVNQIF